MVTWLFVDFQMMRCLEEGTLSFCELPCCASWGWMGQRKRGACLFTDECYSAAWSVKSMRRPLGVLHSSSHPPPPSWWFLTGLPLSIQTATRKVKPMIKAQRDQNLPLGNLYSERSKSGLGWVDWELRKGVSWFVPVKFEKKEKREKWQNGRP